MVPRPINIIIPMGGLGSRFEKNGYILPKPLVTILGRSMISWLLGNLHVGSEDDVYIALQREVDTEFEISTNIKREFPNMRLNFVMLNSLTRGAAETLYMVSKNFDNEQLERPTISLDCDTIYFSDVLSAFRELGDGEGCCAYFKDLGSAPIFSYISVIDDGSGSGREKIVDIAEKKAISRNANTGGYGFPSARVLNEYVMQLLEKPLPDVGEFYVSGLISSMIKEDVIFRGVHVDNFDCVGTPKQLESFFQSALSRPEIIQRVTVVIDMGKCEDMEGDVKSWNDDDVVKSAVPDMIDIYDRAVAIGLDVLLSFEDGVIPKHCDRFTFASRGQRDTAKEEGRLFAVDNYLQKAFGWYL